MSTAAVLALMLLIVCALLWLLTQVRREIAARDADRWERLYSQWHRFDP